MKRQLKLNPKNDPASWQDVKDCRNKFEQSPIIVNGRPYDCDLVSEKRMSWAIDQFENLPTVVDGSITWKLADNTFINLTKQQLQNVLSAIRTNVAARSAMLHYRAEIIAQMPSLTVRQLENPELWGLNENL